ncbi:MAG: hypothetical protein AUJ12_00550 [Alphaproteobacteria bacterium CG1_02_46_17]|nr:MAG: hypothetical protein AUJ12_00550 [Alphaproteobacteria bacterium CG1_02_46_17]
MTMFKPQFLISFHGLYPLIGMALLLALFVPYASWAAELPSATEQGDEKAVSQTEYLGEMSDIPMMSGMIGQDGGGFVFDAPDGRVVEEVVFLEGKSKEQVLDYYATILPKLGWIARKSWVFSRNNEQLTVNIDKVAGGLKVTFRLSPQPSPESD